MCVCQCVCVILCMLRKLALPLCVIIIFPNVVFFMKLIGFRFCEDSWLPHCETCFLSIHISINNSPSLSLSLSPSPPLPPRFWPGHHSSRKKKGKEKAKQCYLAQHPRMDRLPVSVVSTKGETDCLRSKMHNCHNWFILVWHTHLDWLKDVEGFFAGNHGSNRLAPSWTLHHIWGGADRVCRTWNHGFGFKRGKEEGSTMITMSH